MNNIYRRLPHFLLCASILSGCAATTMKSTWQDPSYSFTAMKSVLIIGVSQKDLVKRTLEDQFVAQLATRGIKATSSYQVLPPGAVPDEASLAAFVHDKGISAILVTRLTDRRTEEQYIPPTQTTTLTAPMGYYGYYQDSRQLVTTTTPGYTSTQSYASLETRIFDSATGKPVWIGSSETLLSDNIEKLVKGYVRLIVKKMLN